MSKKKNSLFGSIVSALALYKLVSIAVVPGLLFFGYLVFVSFFSGSSQIGGSGEIIRCEDMEAIHVGVHDLSSIPDSPTFSFSEEVDGGINSVNTGIIKGDGSFQKLTREWVKVHRQLQQEDYQMSQETKNSIGQWEKSFENVCGSKIEDESRD